MRQRLVCLLGIGLLLGGVAPAAAQWRFDIGVNGGGSFWTPFVGEEQTGSGSVAFKAGWLVGAQATGWLTPRVGLRLNFAFEDRGLKASDGELANGVGGVESLEHTNLWAPSIDLLFRLKRPSEEFQSGEWLPYLAIGGGLRYINPAGDYYVTYDTANNEVWPGVPFSVAGGDTLFLSELSPGMGLVALGTDLRLSPGFALRLEVGDRIQKPFAYSVYPVGTSGRVFYAVDGRENDADFAHDIYGTVGLHLTFGGDREAEVVAAAPPPPPPPPPATPAQPAQPTQPTPAPREEAVSVCVIDPASPGGMRMVSATFLPDSRDTVVVVNGQRTSFRTTLPTVTTAANADWLIAGRPLEVSVRPATARFLPVGQTQTMGEGSLVLLGTLNGMPVYANRTDVSAVATRFGTTGELTTVLADAELRRAFDAVQTIYVPYHVAGCAFQPLQRQEEVRK